MRRGADPSLARANAPLGEGVAREILPVLVNARAGRTRGQRGLARRVGDALASAGLEADVEVIAPDGIGPAARRARERGAPVVVVAGGDGTVGTAAQELAGTPATLGVLPLGTRNHFARDLGIPPDLADAAQVIARGEVRPVDVGMLGERVFVNNSVLGLYPYLVRERERHERRLAWGSVRALLRALWAVFWRFPLLQVRLQASGAVTAITTPVVFVGNNAYAVGPDLGRRERLDQGVLFLCLVRSKSRAGFLRLCLRSLLHASPRPEDIHCLLAGEVTIDVPRKGMWVALDGEVHRQREPLVYRIRPRALRVLAPPAPCAAPSPVAPSLAAPPLAAPGERAP